MNTIKFLSYTGTFILVVNTFLFLIRLPRKGTTYKSFFLYLLSLAAVQITTIVMAIKNINNHFLSTYYLFFQFVLLSAFFYFLFAELKSRKTILIKYTAIVITAGLIIQYIASPKLYLMFNALGFFITSAAIILFSVLYLYEGLSGKVPFLRTTGGIFGYHISSSLIFVSATALVSFDDTVNLLLWYINAALFIIYQLLISWEWLFSFYPKTTK